MKSDFKFNPGECKKAKNSLAHPTPGIVSSLEGRHCRRCG
jgi:hypothetical protein